MEDFIHSIRNDFIVILEKSGSGVALGGLVDGVMKVLTDVMSVVVTADKVVGRVASNDVDSEEVWSGFVNKIIVATCAAGGGIAIITGVMMAELMGSDNF